MTNGVLNAIPVEIQMIIWAMIEDLKTRIDTIDYLQIFELKPHCKDNSQPQQHIQHSQEKPPYKTEITIDFGNAPVKEKIYVIDDHTHSTMLLASEY